MRLIICRTCKLPHRGTICTGVDESKPQQRAAPTGPDILGMLKPKPASPHVPVVEAPKPPESVPAVDPAPAPTPISTPTKFDRKAYMRDYMREYMRKRRREWKT